MRKLIKVTVGIVFGYIFTHILIFSLDKIYPNLKALDLFYRISPIIVALILVGLAASMLLVLFDIVLTKIFEE